MSKLSQKMKTKPKPKAAQEYEGDTGIIVSTGSTLLDLAISGTRVRGGGIPTGIVVEIFGPHSSGKTVLSCEIAGSIQSLGGDVKLRDGEARLERKFAELFGVDLNALDLSVIGTVSGIFDEIKKWETTAPVNGFIMDGGAALKSEREGEGNDGYGTGRAMEYSTGFRDVSSMFRAKNILMVVTNQLRQKIGAPSFGEKYKTTGGEATGFYASIRLQIKNVEKNRVKKSRKGVDHSRVESVTSTFHVVKSSVDAPFRTAEVTINFDYGIDDIRDNLKYLKKVNKTTAYMIGDKNVGKSLNEAIITVENDNLEKELKEEVIDTWEEIQGLLKTKRKPKKRL